MPPALAPAPAAAHPKAAPAPSPQPKPSADITPPAPIEKPIEFDSDIDAELASMDDEKPRQAPQPKAPAKATAKAPEKPQDKPKAKEDETPPEENPDDDTTVQEPETKPDDAKVKPDVDAGKPVKAADLRTAYEGLKKKVKEEFEPKVAKLESRIKELETGTPEKLSAVVEELKTTKAKLDEYEKETKFTNYKKSQEFQEKYEKPYKDAWVKAMKDLSELKITDDEGNERVANASDMMMISNLPLGEARAKAKEIFGEAADDVMAHRRVIRELSEAQTKALDDAKTNASEHEKRLVAQREIQHQEISKQWEEANKSLSEKYPKWFAETEGDTEGNELLRKGFSLADLHFLTEKNLKPEQIEMLPPRFRDAIKANGGELPIKERVALDALLRHKIASHSRLARNLKTANTRIAELEKSLADYEKSEPTGRPGGGKAGEVDPISEADAELDALDRRHS